MVAVSSELPSGLRTDCAQRRKCCAALRNRPRLLWSLVVAAVVGPILSVAGYLFLPQQIIQLRIAGATVDIATCVLEIGPHAAAQIQPEARFSVPREVLAVPLVHYEATVHGFYADIYFSKAEGDDVPIGKFVSNETLTVDSREDMDVQVGGTMFVTEPDLLGEVVNHFVKEPTIVLTMEAKVDIHSKVWGWLPVPLYGITVRKSLKLPAFDNFRAKMIALDGFVSAHGSPGLLNLTASVAMYNPTPVRMVLRDSLAMHVFYSVKGLEYQLGILNVEAPFELNPGDNLATGMVTVRQTTENDLALKAAIAAYIGPQDGIMPAGASDKPLVVRMADGFSESTLLNEATRGLSVDVKLRPKPMSFLSAITADVVGFSSWQPPFYKVVVHLGVTNPLPQVVHVREIKLVAHHLSLAGPVLYHYTREIGLPSMDPAMYVLDALETRTLNFELNPLSEVSWGFLFSVREILDLLEEAAERNITVGIDLELTVAIADDYVQTFRYENEALSGMLCFHATAPTKVCGGLPGHWWRSSAESALNGTMVAAGPLSPGSEGPAGLVQTLV